MPPITLFVVNPGSTSTKIALYRDARCLFERTIRHDASAWPVSGGIIGQLQARRAAVEATLEEALAACGIQAEDIDAFVGRGGLVHNVPSGIYKGSEDMLRDLREARYGEHASNLGAMIASDLALRFGKPAYIADPPPVDEMISLARYSGLPIFFRKSVFHALNQKTMARRAAAEIGLPYERCNLVVAHLGGGISVGAHQDGHVIDVNDALEEGPFSPDRAGSVPSLQLLDLCFSGKYDRKAIYRMLVGQGGLYAYTGSTDCLYIEKEAASRPEYLEILQAMAYQVAKSIGACAASLGRMPDAIVLTGGLARSDWLTREIANRVGFLGRILIYPGENELEALASAVRSVLSGQGTAREYVREPD
jgi:butyrate kinase